MSTGQYGTDPLDVCSHHARQTIESHIKSLGASHNPIRERGKEPRPMADRNIDKSNVLPVAIIGVGVGGLYTAMILESLDIPFKIIEASDRTGGRLLTYKFSEADAQYYDNIKDNINLIPFKFADNLQMAYLHYNGFGTRQKDLPHPPGDFFHFSEVGVSTSDPDYFNPSAGYDNIRKDVLKDYVVALEADLQNGGDAGWTKLMSKDRYSTRAYLSLDYEPNPQLNIGKSVGLPIDVINWCETMSEYTGGYDRAFSETVLESMAFGATYPPINPDWKCLDGGSAKLTEAMVLALKTPVSIIFKTSVTAIGLTNPELGVASTMTVEDSGGGCQEYSHVISTLPLPVLRTLDLSNSTLTLYQQNALRQLDYGRSIKIGVHFKSAWWTYGIDKSQPGIVGGQSYTNMPIRTIVYPSYGLDRPPSDPAVLIVSYCWTEDAQHLGALIADFNSFKFNANTPLSNPLAKLVLRDLAKVHNMDLSFLATQVMVIHPWDWNTDRYAMGASAFFGPGDFKNLYNHMTQPAVSGRLHFAGEAISARHAWVVGALDSAWRAVHELLICSDLWNKPELLAIFYAKWGFNQDWITPQGITARTSDESVPSIKHNLHVQHIYTTQPDLFEPMGTE